MQGEIWVRTSDTEASPVKADNPFPVGVSGVDGEGLKRSILTDSSGQQIVIQKFIGVTRQSFSFTASGQTQAVEVPSGANSVSVEVSGVFVGQANLMYSPDSTNGADGNWYTLVGHSPGALNAQLSNVTNLSTSLKADIPASARYVQVSCSSLSSGTMAGLLSTGNAIYSGVTTGQALLQAGVSRAGFMPRAAIWTRESTTPVNANLSISGSAKTTFNTSSGTALNTSTSYGDKFAAAAGANVVGTLIIDASPDSGTTYYPVASVTLTQIGGAGNFGAYLETPIVEATMRARLVNGASNQANAFLSTRMLG